MAQCKATLHLVFSFVCFIFMFIIYCNMYQNQIIILCYILFEYKDFYFYSNLMEYILFWYVYFLFPFLSSFESESVRCSVMTDWLGPHGL